MKTNSCSSSCACHRGPARPRNFSHVIVQCSLLKIYTSCSPNTIFYRLPYLPVYNTRPCIINTPIFRLHLEKNKKKGRSKQRMSFRKTSVKNHVLDTLKKKLKWSSFQKFYITTIFTCILLRTKTCVCREQSNDYYLPTLKNKQLSYKHAFHWQMAI